MKPTPHIRRRLTAWSAGSVVVLMLVAMLSVRSFSRHALAVQHEESIDRAVELVRAFFRTELSEYNDVEVTIAHITEELVFAGMGVEFLRPDGTIFARAAETGTLEPPARRVTMPLEPRLAPGWRLRLDVSIADLRSAQRRIDQGTWIALPVAVALAAMATWLVIGRVLRPVELMADAAEEIDADNSRSRLPIADANDELGRLGRRFNALLDRLDGALAQQRRFLADAAHELRTPLARMLGETETTLSSPPSDEDREALVRIHHDLGRASTLVDELMQLARAEAGGTHAVFEDVYLDDVLSDAMAPWHAEAKRREIILDVESLEETPVRVDPRLTHRLVGILVNNALQYTPPGGAISVRVVRAHDGALLEVDDSGIGIPPGERERVFERFFRGVLARQRVPEGSGLGLAIAAWIARQHGAAISVEDGERGGALIRVRFPLRATPPQQFREPPAPARPPVDAHSPAPVAQA